MASLATLLGGVIYMKCWSVFLHTKLRICFAGQHHTWTVCVHNYTFISSTVILHSYPTLYLNVLDIVYTRRATQYRANRAVLTEWAHVFGWVRAPRSWLSQWCIIYSRISLSISLETRNSSARPGLPPPPPQPLQFCRRHRRNKFFSRWEHRFLGKCLAHVRPPMSPFLHTRWIN